MAAPAPEIRAFGKNQKNLKEIKDKLLRPALTSHFICEFSIPSAIPNTGLTGLEKFLSQRKIPYNSTLQELITLSCSEASLPGSSVATIDIENDYHGVSEKHAYRRLYDDRADFTFYVDRNYDIIKFFESWISYVVGENDLARQETGRYSYRVNYPKSYKTDNLYITKFERDIGTREKKQESLQYKFINAYPISINSMPVSYDTSQLLKCTVSFYYSRYVVIGLTGVEGNSSDPNNPNNPNNTNNSGNPESNFSNGVLLNRRLSADSGRFERIPSAGILDVGITNVG
jgi:hypothetical protein